MAAGASTDPGPSAAGVPPGGATGKAHGDARPLQPAARYRERFWAAFMAARVLVATVLLLLQGALLGLSGTQNSIGLLIGLGYLTATVVAKSVLTPFRSPGSGQWPWLPTVGVDLVVFALLQSWPQSNLNYALLLALPVLMTAVLGPQRRALATAAMVTLYLLGDAAWMAWAGPEDAAPRFLQTAIAGTGYFLLALLAHQLAVRLAAEEALSEYSQWAARSQARVNELVIADMNDGVLVVDRSGRLQAANPAARHLLGGSAWAPDGEVRLDQHRSLAALMELVGQTLDSQQAQTAELVLTGEDGHRQRLRARTRPTSAEPQPSASAEGAGLCVVFLEDLHELEARVRAEKLAGMGRMSVAVAHEIRNPLSAIAQATELLAEDLRDPQQQRLAQMVANHTQRLNRIVDDILNVVRLPGHPAPPDAPVIALDDATLVSLNEWCEQHGCTQRLVRHLGCGPVRVQFDPEHLRRILVNLLDNASRYASAAPGAIQVSTRTEPEGQLRLAVWSDGAPLEASVRRHLFEPFFSSESRSSGMGLYLCRELCERYGATLDYQRSDRGGRSGNEFFLLMAVAPPTQAP
jgi:two-component system sensor histidine kinase PilS (NtrC family)